MTKQDKIYSQIGSSLTFEKETGYNFGFIVSSLREEKRTIMITREEAKKLILALGHYAYENDEKEYKEESGQ
jgi:hypothetical protein